MPSITGIFIGRLFRRGKQLFHMLVGVAFLFLTLAGVSVSIGLWKDYHTMPEKGPWAFSMVACFTVLLLLFSLYSFLKARSVR
ncbi:MAG TPA: hypothetical protein VMW54_12535 [Terriglobia bacterium]|nr:hypothetical protein [Terriglobia bacterium]